MLDIRTILDAMYSNAVDSVSPMLDEGDPRRKLTIRRRRREDDNVDEITNAMFVPTVDRIRNKELRKQFNGLKGDVINLYVDDEDQKSYIKYKDSLDNDMKLQDLMESLAHEIQHSDDFNKDPDTVRAMLDDYGAKAADFSTEEGRTRYMQYPAEVRAQLRSKIQWLRSKYDAENNGESFRDYLLNWLHNNPIDDVDEDFKHKLYKTFYKMADTVEDFENDPRHVGLSSDKRLKNIVKHNRDSFR